MHPLLQAISSGDHQLVKELLGTGYSVNVQDEFKKQAIHYACRGGNLDIVITLLEAGASMKATDEFGLTPLLESVQAGHLQIAECLIAWGSDVRTCDKEGANSLHYVVKSSFGSNPFNYLKLMTIFLEKGLDVNSQTNNGATPLHQAAKRGKDLGLLFLLLRNAKVNLTDNEKCTALHHSVMAGQENTVELLLRFGADKDAQSNLGTCITMAEATGNKDIIQLLTKPLRQKPKFLSELQKVITDFDKWYAVESANQTKKARTVATLFQKAKDGLLPDLKKILSTSGMGVMERELTERQTLLHVASSEGHVQMVQWLIKSKAEVNAVDLSGDTPLHRALMRSHLSVGETLLSAGGEVRVINKQGTSPLHYAVRASIENPFEYLYMLHLILQKGADVNLKNENAETPLYQAAFSGRALGVIYLLQNRGDFRQAAKNDLTPLHVACMFGHTTVVEILVKHGADVGQRSPEGTCMEIAEKTNNREIIRLLFDLSGITGANATTSSHLEELEQTITEFYKSLHAETIEKKKKPIWNKLNASRTNMTDKRGKLNRVSVNTKGSQLITSTGVGISTSSSSSGSGVNQETNSKDVDKDFDQRQLLTEEEEEEEEVGLRFEQTKKAAGEEFEELRKLGEGAYGKVFSAMHKSSGFVVAIKRLPITEEHKKTIEKEIKILKQCRHPNIVQYYGCFFQQQNEISIIMEFCVAGCILDVGSTLGKPFTEEQLAALFDEVLHGLGYLHEKKLVHRDLKAQNILITHHAVAKIADFGVSGQLEMASQLGTPLFSSPESLNGEKYDYSTDIWSVGITALQIMEGQPPHYEKNLMRAIYLIINGDPPKVKNPENYSPEYVQFVDACLQKDPLKRPKPAQLLEHPFIRDQKRASHLVMADMLEECKRNDPNFGNINASVTEESDPITQAMKAAAEGKPAETSKKETHNPSNNSDLKNEIESLKSSVKKLSKKLEKEEKKRKELEKQFEKQRRRMKQLENIMSGRRESVIDDSSSDSSSSSSSDD